MTDVFSDPSNQIYSTIPVPNSNIVVNIYEDGTITKHQPNQDIMTITPDNEISTGLSNKKIKILANGEVYKTISNYNTNIIKITPDNDILKLNYIENQLDNHIIIKSDDAIRKGKRDFQNGIFNGIIISTDDIIKRGKQNFQNGIFDGIIIYPDKTTFKSEIDFLDHHYDNIRINPKKRRRNSL